MHKSIIFILAPVPSLWLHPLTSYKKKTNNRLSAIADWTCVNDYTARGTALSHLVATLIASPFMARLTQTWARFVDQTWLYPTVDSPLS